MAGRKSGYRFFAQSMEKETGGGFASDEFDESDVWGCSIEPRQAAAESIRNNPIPWSRSNRKKSAAADKGDRVAASSLPVNIPDWSKILKDEYRGNYNNINSSYNNNNNNNNNGRLLELGDVEDEDDEGKGMVIPPHELLWKNRGASFSVHEGIGRTLKGRDLSRVRNAIFEKIGFED